MRGPVFISYSSKDSKIAMRICEAIEQRGLACWISSRDVAAGDNYQESIVRAIGKAGLMVLVFSANANNSDEIKKELSLASRSDVIVIPARIEDITPSGAFAFELSTRQWIDLFLNWEDALDRLADRVETAAGGRADEAAPGSGSPATRANTPAAAGRRSSVGLWAAIAGALILLAGGGIAWRWFGAPQATRQASAPEDTRNPAPGAVEASRVERTTAAPVAAPPPDPRAFSDCEGCPPMVEIPAGAVMIGSPDRESGHDKTEEPRAPVSIARPFAIGVSAVTFDQWNLCVAEDGCGHYMPTDMGWGRGDRPAIFVSWSDAQAYVDWLSKKTGKRYRLPSEAEWEYAARGCVSQACAADAFWFGAIDPDRANYDWRVEYLGSRKALALRATTPVGRFPANPFGLRDAVGNVAQWTADCWSRSLAGTPTDGSARTSGDCASHPLRGGSWTDEPINLRSAARRAELAKTRLPYVGFRVARDLPR